MPSQGPRSPATGADQAGIGTLTWTNPGNILSSNNVYSTVIFGGSDVTHYLKATNFGFTIPAGSTINGIQVEIERSWSISGGGNIVDNVVSLVIGGTVTGNNKASLASWPSSDAYQSYGGASDLWGTTPTSADINGSTFGAVLSAKETFAASIRGRVDHFRITVTYTLPNNLMYPFWYFKP